MKRNIFVFQHVDCEGPGAFGGSAAALEIRDPSRRLPSRDEIAASSGLIVLGGPMGVYETERYPWMTEEIDRVACAVRAGKPVLGVCLGSQILAAALGARVYPHARKEIGWDDIELLAGARDDPLLTGLPSTVKAFHWHGDTFDLPAGAVHLASSRTCRNQAFRFGPNAWGLQCHLEIDRDDPLNWAQVYCEEVRETGAPTVGTNFRADTEMFWPLLRNHAERVATRFVTLCSPA